MGERAHTPGPWRAVKAPHGPVDIFDSQNRDIVTVYGGGPGSESKVANALLIAAAPDLLDACKRASEILRGRGYPGWGIAKDILNEAIAKAEGRAILADATPSNPSSMEGR